MIEGTRELLDRKVGTTKLKELLFEVPKRYERVSKLDGTEEEIEKTLYCFEFYVDRSYTKGNQVFVSGTTGTLNQKKITLIHNKKMIFAFKKGRSLWLTGQLSGSICLFPMIKQSKIGFFPVYKGDFPSEALKNFLDETDCEFLSHEQRTLLNSMRAIHFPTTEQEIDLAFEQLWLLELSVFLRLMNKIGTYRKPYSIFLEPNLPFELTKQQRAAVDNIYSDLSKDKSFARLIFGEVGSGKTIVSFLAAWQVVLNGKQVVFLSPTTILAQQTYEAFLKFAPEISTAFLSSDSSLFPPDPMVFIGTHALLYSDYVVNLGLLIVDEQHRFGVEQRNKILRNSEADLLMLSATPIPRTLSMIVDGYVSVSKITEKPNLGERQTSILNVDRRELLIERVLKVAEKNRVLWVCRTVQQANNTQEFFSKYVTSLVVHGEMKNKDLVIEQFKAMEKGILVSTTVIEVGIDIDVNYVIIEEADRFGVAQLHQLRGRVGRREKKGFCVLLGTNLEKLKKIKESETGEQIAELDMKNRGKGSIAGKEQKGKINFRFSKKLDKSWVIERDLEPNLLEKARLLVVSDELSSIMALNDYVGL